jgi:hypothetical protein
VLRRQTFIVAILAGVTIAIAIFSLYRSHVAAERQELEADLRARNLGRFTLSLEPFDWNPETQTATPADPAPVGLSWQLRTWTDDGPGALFVEHEDVERDPSRIEGKALVQDVEARGGRAYLVIERGRCTPSRLPLKELPGYAQRDQPRRIFNIRIPSCAATLAGTVEVPDGMFRYGGAGTPPSKVAADLGPEQRLLLRTFRIDRTEVTNAAFAMFGKMFELTGVESPSYPSTSNLGHASEPRKPVTGVNWFTARDYCWYMGKDLPTSQQWVKAMRGGEKLPDGSDNPIPDRNYPFGGGNPYELAALIPDPGTDDVGTHPRDRSPYDVLDMTGNAEEWTLTPATGRGTRVIRGGGIAEPVGDAILDVMAIPNTRVASQPLFTIGERCVVNGK